MHVSLSPHKSLKLQNMPFLQALFPSACNTRAERKNKTKAKKYKKKKGLKKKKNTKKNKRKGPVANPADGTGTCDCR